MMIKNKKPMADMDVDDESGEMQDGNEIAQMCDDLIEMANRIKSKISAKEGREESGDDFADDMADEDDDMAFVRRKFIE